MFISYSLYMQNASQAESLFILVTQGLSLNGPSQHMLLILLQ